MNDEVILDLWKDDRSSVGGERSIALLQHDSRNHVTVQNLRDKLDS